LSEIWLVGDVIATALSIGMTQNCTFPLQSRLGTVQTRVAEDALINNHVTAEFNYLNRFFPMCSSVTSAPKEVLTE
jgi:hypothetical protein